MSEYGGLFTEAELDREINAGFVRCNEHPDDNEMWILNYTEKAAFDNRWNNVTLNCRGLIIGPFCNIIARPFSKFFNYGQTGCPEISLDTEVVVSDKMDGSLGIMYREKMTGKYAIATRGSFTSAQAVHATEILRTKYADYIPPQGLTLLFEIIYPENRIVCNYGDMDDLVLLGSVDIVTGDNWDAGSIDWGWPGPKAESFPYLTFGEALAAPPRPGKEGFVVNAFIEGFRVKIKQEDYIKLHRIVTGLNARSVWAAMVEGTFDELLEQVPDEFHGFVRGVQKDIREKVRDAVELSFQTFYHIVDDCLADNATKKDFAELAKQYSYSWALFNLWDSRPIHEKWLQIYKPAHDYSPVKVSNDAD